MEERLTIPGNRVALIKATMKNYVINVVKAILQLLQSQSVLIVIGQITKSKQIKSLIGGQPAQAWPTHQAIPARFAPG